MKNYNSKDFTFVNSQTILSEACGCYILQPIRHKTGHTINVLLDNEGNTVSQLNEITANIKVNYSLNGEATKLIPILIDDVEFIVVMMPTTNKLDGYKTFKEHFNTYKQRFNLTVKNK